MNYVQNAVKAALEANPFRAEMSPQQLVDALDLFWSQVAMKVKSSMKDAQLQGIYAVLFSQVRLECNRIAWEDEPMVYTRVANRNTRKDIAAILLVISAAVMLLTAYIMNNKHNTLGLVLCSIALVLLIAGIALQTIKGESSAYLVEQRLRPQAICKSLEATASAMDSNAENLLNLVNPVGESKGLEALELVRELYRASAHEDENVHSALTQYLRQNSVKEVTFSPDTASLFDVMPSNGTKTIQPALVQETATGRHIISKGLACVQMNE